jgi:succinate dehydrogenase/fumarate reductase flavoprotein subunit
VPTEDAWLETDVLIIGSEGAGARAAIEAAEAGCDVLCLTKSAIGKSGATLTADADIDVDSNACIDVFGLPGDRRDSEEAFFEDMVVEGDYTANQRLVDVHVREAAQRTKEIVEWGARIDRLTHAPGHRYPRGIWIPGIEFRRVLSREVKRRPIKLLQNFMFTDLLTDEGRVVGAVGVDLNTGEFTVIQAKATVLCTGGAMRMYEFTTAPEELTGDGLAAAYRVGAELADMEFPMFLPYILIHPKAVDGVDYTYLLSAYLDSYALNRSGERYMAKWDRDRMERTTRDVNSVAAMIEVLEGRGSPHHGTYLSLAHFPKNVLEFAMKEWLPTNVANYKYGGFNMREFLPDLHENAVETAPACHFWNGGIVIDEWCRTTVDGLWAAGEGTGLIHGANRLSGNALTMTQVFGPRAGIDAARGAKANGQGTVDRSQAAELRQKAFQFLGRAGEDPIDLRNRIRHLAHLRAGPVRDDSESLRAAIDEVETMKKEWAGLGTRTSDPVYNQEWIEAIQNENLLTCLELVLRTSLLRTESRGAAYRRDHPETNNRDWVKNLVVRRGSDGQPQIEERPVVVTSLTPPNDIRRYGQKRLVGPGGET